MNVEDRIEFAAITAEPDGYLPNSTTAPLTSQEAAPPPPYFHRGSLCHFLHQQRLSCLQPPAP